RDEILDRIRTILSRPELSFPPVEAPPLTADERMTVTHAEGDAAALARRFGQELEKLYGSYEILASAIEVRLALINRLTDWAAEEDAARKGPKPETFGQERMVLSWAPAQLPIDGLAEALADMQWQLVAPDKLTSPEALEKVRFIRFGVTGVEAAFASTGSMLVVSGPGTNRSASLLPFRHIALIPFSRLYPTMEAWLAERRAAGELVDLLRTRAGWNMITGPSKSADIEMNLTLGVHGPKYVHAILFDDTRPVISEAERAEIARLMALDDDE
ncbi:MAG: LUD domain-containing protein, partial [Anaerolineales bacterium]|nr:LUD domain-containing protein [Anaerolineales bacterium]